MLNEVDIKQVEKRLQEDLNTLWNSKLILSEKVAKFEADNHNFVSNLIKTDTLA